MAKEENKNEQGIGLAASADPCLAASTGADKPYEEGVATPGKPEEQDVPKQPRFKPMNPINLGSTGPSLHELLFGGAKEEEEPDWFDELPIEKQIAEIRRCAEFLSNLIHNFLPYVSAIASHSHDANGRPTVLLEGAFNMLDNARKLDRERLATAEQSRVPRLLRTIE